MLGAGFAEDIITELGRNRELTVIARHSSFAAKAQGRTSAEIADMLGVRYLLEGSLRRAGERMVINAQLIDMRDSRHVWAERYSFSAAELFVVQDELAARIAGYAVLGGPRGRDGGEPAPPAGQSGRVWTRLAGRGAWAPTHRDSTIASRAEAERAVALDPDFGRAHIRLGMTPRMTRAWPPRARSGRIRCPSVIAIDPARHRAWTDERLWPPGARLRAIHGRPAGRSAAGRGTERCLRPQRRRERSPSSSIAQGGVGDYAEALASIERGSAQPVIPGIYRRHRGLASLRARPRRRGEPARQRRHGARAKHIPSVTLLGPPRTWRSGARLRRRTNRGAAARVPGFTMQSPRIAQAYVRDRGLRERFVQHLREAGLPGGD